MRSWKFDLRHTARGLWRSRWLSLAAVAALGVGLGANAAMYQVVHALFLRAPVGVERPEELVSVGVEESFPGVGEFTNTHHPYVFLSELQESAPEISFAGFTGRRLSVGSGPDAYSASATLASAAFFELLEVTPALGRWPSADEARPGEPSDVVVLGHSFWRRRLGSDPGVLGRTLRVANDPLTIVGVAPPGFTGLEPEDRDLWLPINALDRLGDSPWAESPNYFFLQVVARLPSGTAVEPAEGRVAAAWRRIEEMQGQGGRERESRGVLEPVLGRKLEGDREAQVTLWLTGVAAMVLLIACANVANLQVARLLRRRRDLAVRRALGASRGQLARRALLESLALAGLGGLAAALALDTLGGLLQGFLLPRVPEPLPSERLATALFLAGAAALAGLLAGLGPALQAARRPPTSELQAAASAGAGTRGNRLQAGLVAFQVGLGFVLLVGTGLFVRSLGNATSLDLGFDTEHVLVTDVDFQGFDLEQDATTALYRDMASRVRRLPGVESVAVVAGIPLETSFATSFQVPGGQVPRGSGGGPYIHAVSEDYFRVTGIDLLRGEPFEDRVHRADGPPVVIVNDTFARLAWPEAEGSPIGRCLEFSSPDGTETPCTRVIGVCETARRHGIEEEATAQLYVPLEQCPGFLRTGAFLVRRAEGTADLGPAIRRELQAVRPDLPYVRVRSLAEMLAPQLHAWTMGARLFGLFGAMAFLLSALGTYAVVAFTVVERTREVGLRMALGADRPDVLRLVIRRGLALGALGVVAGLALVLSGGRYLEPLLYQVEPGDPWTLALATVTCTLAAGLASLLPALRATRVAPAIALRAD